MDLRKIIRAVEDWPEAGVTFRDITPLFKQPEALQYMVDTLCERFQASAITHIACIDARGFLVASVMAYKLGLPLLLVRKQGKLPGPCIQQDYTLEYGTTSVEMQVDACGDGDKILLFDDLIATGGTLLAAINLIRRLGAEVVDVAAIVDLPALGGSHKVEASGVPCFSLCAY